MFEPGHLTEREAAVSVRGLHAGGVFGHRCSGGRVLRAVSALLRPGAHRVSPGARGDRGRAHRVRDARLERRVPRTRAVRRPARGLRSGLADRAVERHVRVRGVQDRRRGRGAADGDRHPGERADQSRRPEHRPGAGQLPAARARVRGRASCERNRGDRGDRPDRRGRRTTPDDILRGAVSALVDPGGCSWAGILFVESGELVLGPQAGIADPGEPSSGAGDLRRHSRRRARRGRVPTTRTFLDRVAFVISPYCLVGWDTGGVPWDAEGLTAAAAPACGRLRGYAVALDRHLGPHGRRRYRASRLDVPLRLRRARLRRSRRRADGAPYPPRPVHDVLLGPGLRRFAGSAAHRADLRGVRLELARTPSRPDRTLGSHGDPHLARRVAADGRASRLQLQRRSSGSGPRS